MFDFGLIRRPPIRILIIVLCTRVVTRTNFQCTAQNSEYSVPISGKRPYLSQMADNQKYKGTLLSRTLKVGEKNVPSEFRFMAYWPRYGRFYICFSITSFPDLPSKSKDSVYLPPKGAAWFVITAIAN